MYNIIFTNLKNFSKKTALIHFLNRYSLMFHMLLACVICFLIEWASRHSFHEAFSFMFDRSLVFLYNSLLVFASLTLAYLFRRRAMVRVAVSAFWLFLGIINGCVLLKRVTPFCYTDFKMIEDLFTMQSNYFSKTEAAQVIIGVGAALALLIWLFFKGPKYEGNPHRFASVLSLGAWLFLIPIVTDAAVSGNVLAGYFENIAQGYFDNGFIYSFSASVIGQGMKQPKGYGKETVAKALASITEAPSSPPEEKPNIVCVLLESFVDPYEVNFLKYSEDPTPNFHALSDAYTTGYLQVPVVGAGTANTEFEILTGMGIQFFGLGEYPYKTILKKTSCESIAGDLGKLGYGSHVVHNNGGNFYSRANAFSQMGFDTFTCKELIDIHEYTPLGAWATDNCLIKEVNHSMDLTEGTDFVYTITVQGHGNYPTEPIIEHPEIAVSGAPTLKEYYAWEYYINQIHEVDRFIGDLIDSLSQRNEKTIVVFFGDHIPTMGLAEEDLASNSLFLTKYVTWNNFGLEKNDKNLTSYQLLSYILDELNIHSGTMVSYHQSRDYVLSEDYESDMRLLQYDILYGKRYAYGGQDLYPASRLVMGNKDVILSSLEPSGEYLYVHGTNFTPWSHVFVNGEKVPTLYISGNRLVIRMDELTEQYNSIVVNQMGSNHSIFRSSNRGLYRRTAVENPSG